VGAAEPKGRQAKSKARWRFEELSSYEYQKRNETQEIFIRCGAARRLVIELKAVSKATASASSSTISLSACRRSDRRHHRPNGAGKSTLFRMITGKEKADKGKIVIGPTVKIAHVTSRATRSRRQEVWEFISGARTS